MRHTSKFKLTKVFSQPKGSRGASGREALDLKAHHVLGAMLGLDFFLGGEGADQSSGTWIAPGGVPDSGP